MLRVEFARQSRKRGRLTLVLVPDGPEVQGLWAQFTMGTVLEAQRALGEREDLLKNWERAIAVWSRTSGNGTTPPSIAAWALGQGLDAAVWTALPPRFDNKNGRIPTEEEAVAYLRNLSPEKRRDAEEYIRKAPLQVDTPFRRRFEREFGWTPLEIGP